MLVQILENQKIILERLDFLESFGTLDGSKRDTEYEKSLDTFPLKTLKDQERFEHDFQKPRLYRKLVNEVAHKIVYHIFNFFQTDSVFIILLGYRASHKI